MYKTRIAEVYLSKWDLKKRNVVNDILYQKILRAFSHSTSQSQRLVVLIGYDDVHKQDP